MLQLSARNGAMRARAKLSIGCLNVPMLWCALNYRDRSLDDMVALAMAGASQGVMSVAVSRPQNQAQRPVNHDSNERHHQQ